MSWNWREWTVVHCSIFATFVVSSLFYDAAMLVAYLTVKPLSVRLYRKFTKFCLWSMKTQILVLGRQYSGMVVRMEAEPGVLEEPTCHGLFLMNHHYELDFLAAWVVADAAGNLGNGRMIAKRSLSYVPTLGWAWALSDFMFVERNFERDREVMRRGMDVLSTYEDPVWLLLFPEGTRRTKEKLEAGQEFARSRGMNVLKHHLVPRAKGFCQIMSGLDTDRFKYIYDVTMVVNQLEGSSPSIVDIVMGKKVVADFYLRKIKTSDVPKDPEGASKFLFNLFAEKDLLVDSFIKSGGKSFTSDLPDDVKAKFPVAAERAELKPKLGPLVNSIVMNLLVGIPIVYLLASMATSGSMVQLGFVVFLVLSVHFTLKQFLGIVKFKQQ